VAYPAVVCLKWLIGAGTSSPGDAVLKFFLFLILLFLSVFFFINAIVLIPFQIVFPSPFHVARQGLVFQPWRRRSEIFFFNPPFFKRFFFFINAIALIPFQTVFSTAVSCGHRGAGVPAPQTPF